MGVIKKIFEHRVRTIVPLAAVAVGVLWLLLAVNGGRSVALVLALALIILGLGAVLLKAGNDTRHSVEGLAAALSCVALVLAGYWYFVERRGYPKLNIQPEIRTWPIEGDLAFVRVEVRLENVGDTAVTLEPENTVRLEIGQAIPFTGKDERKLRAQASKDRLYSGDLEIINTSKWPRRAVFKEGLDLRVESGEVDRIYFKAIVPCEPGLVSSVRVDIPIKASPLLRFFDPEKRELNWRAQALSEPLEACEPNAGG
ncbi:hypothetical protein [Alteriqipengyuania lutimaris]|uniref:Uncharacterized protein n=1 Tax=Alteriqipengyuania lutimaris TaxID=1538146 RepID=A0A395LHL6_9SPHN|nr:hypothetical protein [Alteriqipengyuania lutimaris]MBB3034717.1 hypothetical protein [Alteriqipengyuania lutimaris]RDS76428.1 hypothetical protein DL238_01595 [Alteriqipengyuania lutimaris]